MRSQRKENEMRKFLAATAASVMLLVVLPASAALAFNPQPDPPGRILVPVYVGVQPGIVVGGAAVR